MVQIATRASWGARFRDGDANLTGLATEIFIHHTVTTTLPATATVAQEQEQMRHLESIGQNRFGTGISYNVIIFPSGRAYQGVSWNRRGAHTSGRNSTARSICFAGNFETHQPTTPAIATAAEIVKYGRGRWWTTTAPVRPHSAVSATACPGKNVRARLNDIRNGTTTPPTTTPPLGGTVTLNNIQLPVIDLRNAERTPVNIQGVSRLQGLLLAHRLGPAGLVGTNGRPDGSAGAQTRRLLGEFQKAHNLTVDFVCGQNTWRKLLGN